MSESEQNKKINFRKTHDGSQEQVNVAERELVSRSFQSLVDDILLNHPENVTQFNGVRGDKPEETLRLRVPLEDKDFLSISVRSRPVGEATERDEIILPEETTAKEIFIQEIKGGYGREMFAYRLGGDGVVTRWDGGDSYAKILEEKRLGIKDELPEDASPEALAVNALKLMDRLVNDAIPNSRLEREMGLNNQPVGIDEFNSVVMLLDAATVGTTTY